MRILLLGSKEYPFGISHKYDKKAGGGIEVHVEKLAKYLAKDGHKVFIITRRFPGQLKKETAGNITIYRTKFIYNKYLRNFTFNFSSFLKAWRLIRKERIDLIHCHGAV
ncbi:MAG: glycosyltransferase family 4 protein, partial [Nanoarchaeota archaeon]